MAQNRLGLSFRRQLLIKHDLDFILKQIKIAEAHAAGTPLDEIRVNAQGNVVATGGTLAISNPLVP